MSGRDRGSAGSRKWRIEGVPGGPAIVFGKLLDWCVAKNQRTWRSVEVVNRR